MSPLKRSTIWTFAQNKPTLVVRDLAEYAPADIVYAALLRRGVFKWLAVRRDLIRLKNTWRERITQAIADVRVAKRAGDGYHVAYLRGYLKAHEECRKEVRALCHSERWRAPDFDGKARRWLVGLES